MKLYFMSRKFNNFRYFVYVVVLVLFLGQPAFGGKLKDFEQDVAEEREEETPPTYYEDEDEEEDSLWYEMMALVFRGIVAGGLSSWERVHPEQSRLEFIQHRELGEALIPFFRIDVGYQNVETDVEAFDSRAELGYGPFGGQVRFTHYKEQEPSDELEMIQVHGLYRMSLGNHTELDLGFGSLTINGDEQNSGFSLTSPILIHPREFIGIEFRPSWSWIKKNPIRDYDLGLVLSRSHVSLRLGYRWVRSAHESLDGPYVGLSLRF